MSNYILFFYIYFHNKFLQSFNEKKKIAVIGSGISGLSCAWNYLKSLMLSFECDKRFGGHSNTVEINEGEKHKC